MTEFPYSFDSLPKPQSKYYVSYTYVPAVLNVDAVMIEPKRMYAGAIVEIAFMDTATLEQVMNHLARECGQPVTVLFWSRL